MKAALLVEPGRIEVGEVDDPEPGPGDVKVAVAGVGLCGSDLAVFSGRWKAPGYPWVMGHEAFGTIVDVGAGVPGERIGQVVAIEPNAPCFDCDACRSGWTSSCSGRRSVGMNRPGALAQYLVVPSPFAWPVPNLPPEDLVCVEPTTVVLAGIRRLATPLPDEALVIGVGAQGLMMTLILLERGLSVHAQDVNPDKLDFAIGLGAVAARPGDSFPLVVDTVGSPATVDTAVEAVGVGGTILCLGLDDRPFELTAQTIVRRQLRLQGTLTYDHPTDFAATVDLFGGGFRPGRIVTDGYALEDAQTAFESSRSVRGKSWLDVASVND